MGAHSTLRITRQKATELFIKEMIGDIPDETLEQFLDKLLDAQLYNVIIVSNDNT